MLQLDHVAALQVKIGMESLVLDAMVVDNGIIPEENVLVQSVIGTDSHVSNAQPDRDGTHLPYLALAQIIHFGTV